MSPIEYGNVIASYVLFLAVCGIALTMAGAIIAELLEQDRERPRNRRR